ncbi:MAG TPA: hypothetical protein VND95_03515 [Stellaceae bacterium]|nr:hypothetical protein [Stellaceae bacterium]
MAVEIAHFPRLQTRTQAQWAPILISPIMGSMEQLVIGVAAASAEARYVERANMLRRLQCLYGKEAETIIFAAQVAMDELKMDLAERGIAALTNPMKTFSGISIGPVAEGEANSIEELCRNWMCSLSSLYSASAMELMEAAPVQSAVADTLTASGDRLPALVLQYVTNFRPGLERFFNQDVREQRIRRRSAKVHSVIIDFAGSSLVANFATLMASHHAASVDKIKRRMFDLIVQRDTEAQSLPSRVHEMIVQHPALDDPQITDRQAAVNQEGLIALSDQSRREEITFVPMTSVASIGDHVLQAEHRADP